MIDRFDGASKKTAVQKAESGKRNITTAHCAVFDSGEGELWIKKSLT